MLGTSTQYLLPIRNEGIDEYSVSIAIQPVMYVPYSTFLSSAGVDRLHTTCGRAWPTEPFDPTYELMALATVAFPWHHREKTVDPFLVERTQQQLGPMCPPTCLWPELGHSSLQPRNIAAYWSGVFSYQ